MVQHSEFNDFNQLYRRLRGASELPFSDLLSAERVARALAQLGLKFRQRVYTPLATLWMFLGQVLSADHSCQDAVARWLAWQAARGDKPSSSDTGSYCEARQRLPLPLIQQLTTDVARELEAEADEPWLWKGRHVKLVDGSTVTMPDTPANQAAFPQSSGQLPGVGFPIARVVVVFSLATGAALAAAWASIHGKRTGETSLFRRLFGVFQPGDVLLGDRLFASFRDLAVCARRGIDVLARQNASRRTDFRRGRWLGKLDHVTQLQRPCFHSDRCERAFWEGLPRELQVRELRYVVTQRGFRPHEITLVTTLLDPIAYPAEELAQLYRARWECEVDLRALKTSLQMGHLRCQSPAMVEKELWMHLLAYNLIRTVAAAAARRHRVLPRSVSLKGAVQTLNAFANYLPHQDAPSRLKMWDHLLATLAHLQVGHRPNRFEPRKLKKRDSKYTYLTRPRSEERKRLCA